MSEVKDFWVSWYQPGDDCRPVNYPPNEQVIGWWKTGEADEASTIVAWVVAADEAHARKAVEQDWPEFAGLEWRFCEVRECSGLSDRFPPSNWMLPRIEERKAALSKVRGEQ